LLIASGNSDRSLSLVVRCSIWSAATIGAEVVETALRERLGLGVDRLQEGDQIFPIFGISAPGFQKQCTLQWHLGPG